MKKHINREYLKKFIFGQKCIPWFLSKKWQTSYLRSKLYECKALFFNTNTVQYWDNTWQQKMKNIPDYLLYRNKFDSIVSIVPSTKKVLDVGCGIGILMERLLKEKDCQVVGIDMSESAVEYIKKKGMEAKLAKVPPIPYPDNSFDVVIATEFLEHFTRPLLIFDELLRVLKNSGMFITSVPENHGFDTNREHVKKYTEASLCKVFSKRVKQTHILRIQEEHGWPLYLLAYGIKGEK